MRFFAGFAVKIIIVGLLVAAASPAQTPPNQDYVNSIGASPLKAPATTDFTPGASFTMEGWFYLTGNTPGAWLMGKGLATGGTDPFLSFALTLGNDGTKVQFAATTGAAGSFRSIGAPTALPQRTWTHLAAVMDGASMQLLVNGVVVASGTAAGAPLSAPTLPLSIGIAYLASGSTNFPAFPGYARQVRFWNMARTAAQISAALGELVPTDRTGLVAAWPLDESSGATARDLSSAGRALTATSGALLTARPSVLAAGPFFATTTTAVTDGSMPSVNDGQLLDFDNDGDLDLVLWQVFGLPTVPETRTRLRAFRNNSGTFVDVTDAVLGNVTMVVPRHSFVGDFNRDGRSDLLIVGHGTDTPPFPGEQTKLLVQSADGRLVDESATRLPPHLSFTHNVAVADIDGDGDLDIYMCNVNGGDSGPRFYLNNGSGFFTETTDRIPTDIANRAAGLSLTSSLLVDVNGDGFPDLVLGGENSPVNEILLNDRTGRFVRDSRFTLPPKLFGPKAGTVAIASADFNGDGAPDLILGTTGGTQLLVDGRTINGYGVPGLQLLLNRGDGTFYDATASAGFTWSSNERWVVWPRIVDLDGDGRPDIVAEVNTANGARSVRLFLNRGAGQFIDCTEAYTRESIGMFVHAGDFDRDGKVDLITASSNNVTVARALKTIDRGVFQSTPDDPARLVNLSVLTSLASRTDSFTVGYVASGASVANPKPLVIRAAGPALGALGFPGTIDDPKLELFAGPTKTSENEDWGGSSAATAAMAAVGAFAYASPASRDAATVANITSSDNSVRVTAGATSVTGAGAVIAEVYDATSASARTSITPRLINFSVAKQIDAGGNLTLGFVIGGNTPKKMLIRAIGPGLAAVGLTSGTLGDPQLTIYNGASAAIAVNNDWGATSALVATSAKVNAFSIGATPTKDAMVQIELPPGSYTAAVAGNANTSGLAIIEVYEVP